MHWSNVFFELTYQYVSVIHCDIYSMVIWYKQADSRGVGMCYD